MSNLNTLYSKATASHQAKLAYIYIRQSSLNQVMHNTESTDLQYRLVQRALNLGWPNDRIKLIDEDLGKSGSSAVHRAGFQNLIAEIGLGRVGLVLSLDASRLARNNSDWYQLLELCSLFGTLMADSENLYDPRNYHDRLLLGLSGMMSEAELHQLKLRLQAGARNKAERGELRQCLPVGLSRLPGGEVQLNPDEQVQASLRLVFHTFNQLGSAKAVVRYFRQRGLQIPTRSNSGPPPHPIIWQPAANSKIWFILKNPAYAGTYVYGRTMQDPTRRQANHPQSGTVNLPMDKWLVVLQNIYPAYITWEEFLNNQSRLAANQYKIDKPGAPRQGKTLLQGIIFCGICGSRMQVRFGGRQGQHPIYVCRAAQAEYGDKRCQEVRALGLDKEVEQLVLTALEPDKVALALAALEQLQQEEAALSKQWQLRLERTKYESERARRQYESVEPENRLVARNLEKIWEEKLRTIEQVEQEYQNWQRQHQTITTAEDRSAILELGQNLPKVWNANTTSLAERKAMLRFVINQVIVDQRREKGKIWFQINWLTGATTQHWSIRQVRSYSEYAKAEEIAKRVKELVAEEKLDEEIATILNTEGFRTARHKKIFTSKMLWLLRCKWGIASPKANGINPARWEDGSYSVEGAATAVGVKVGTIFKWLRLGKITGQQLSKGTPWKIGLNEEKIVELQEYVGRVRRSKKEAL